ncbi:hypothetical protein BJX99DRAFT_127813 [Aspergillus californicus]
MADATRVILRLSTDEFPNWSDADTVEVLQSFCNYIGRSETELEGEQHYWRTEPLDQETARPQTRFHIILDLEKDRFDGSIDASASLKHEIYRVQRKPSMLVSIKTDSDHAERENLIKKTRVFTDRCYPWGCARTIARRHLLDGPCS